MNARGSHDGPALLSEATHPKGPRAVFYASIHGIGGRLLGHVPVCNHEAGAFEPVEADEFELALARDGGWA